MLFIISLPSPNTNLDGGFLHVEYLDWRVERRRARLRWRRPARRVRLRPIIKRSIFRRARVRPIGASTDLLRVRVVPEPGGSPGILALDARRIEQPPSKRIDVGSSPSESV